VSDMLTTQPYQTESASAEPSPVEALVQEEAEFVEVGDSILISYNDEPQRKHTIRISDTEHDPEMRVIQAAQPLAQALLDGSVDDEIDFPAGGGKRTVTIIEIKKPASKPLEGPSASTEPQEPEAAIQTKIQSPAEKGERRPQNIPHSPEKTSKATTPAASSDSFIGLKGAPEKILRSEYIDSSNGSVAGYTSWSMRRVPDPRDANPGTIAAGLKEIVDVEGPVLAMRVFHLYARAAGIKKVGKVIRTVLDRILSSEISRGTVIASQEFPVSSRVLPHPDTSTLIVRSPESPQVVVRTLGDRSFDEIPPWELAEVMRGALSNTTRHDLESLFRAVLEHYGLKRMTQHVFEQLSRVCSELLSEDETSQLAGPAFDTPEGGI